MTADARIVMPRQSTCMLTMGEIKANYYAKSVVRSLNRIEFVKNQKLNTGVRTVTELCTYGKKTALKQSINAATKHVRATLRTLTI